MRPAQGREHALRAGRGGGDGHRGIDGVDATDRDRWRDGARGWIAGGDGRDSTGEVDGSCEVVPGRYRDLRSVAGGRTGRKRDRRTSDEREVRRGNGGERKNAAAGCADAVLRDGLVIVGCVRGEA